ncbi:Mitochondrial outer membrane protein iml2 [Parahypoxylon ruwenzoriense]
MSRLGSWFRGSAPKPSSSPSTAASQVDLRAQEIAVMEDAMAGAALIMNDDIDGAEERLRKGDSAFHHLGMGVCIFMRSILGFEKAIMVETLNRLNECETASWNEMKKAQKDAGNVSGTIEDRIYPPGSEYALVIADSQLMSAVIAVLHESLTEGIKGFYKLRKAFITLDGIMQAEVAYLEKKGLHLDSSKEHVTSSSNSSTSGRGNDDTDDTDLEFVDADEAHSGTQTPLTYEGHLAKAIKSPEKKLSQLSLDSNATSKPPPGKTKTQASPSLPSGPPGGLESDIFTDPVDIFIHSGVNMCLGSLLLLISMVPPAFSRLLSIIGFKGDRERGVHMLWRSSQYDNINGAVAGLMLLAYYNGLLSFADILPSEEDVENGAVVGYPRARCSTLLSQMRARYPDSGLWRFEEARVLGNTRDLRGALQILKSNTKSKMRQVTALNNFELALNSMYIHEYRDMRDNFLRCVELNDWSHALYYYIAGCAELENYRNAFHEKKSDSQIQRHKKKANELLRKAPTVAGRKRFLAKPLPFEQFVGRKIQKWEERSKDLGIDLVDAIGVSPAEEMVYLWNGMKRMQTSELEMSEKVLSWSRLTAPKEARSKIMAETDEQAVRDVCRAAVARSLGKFDEAREVLDSVLAMDKLDFRGATKDDYPLPAANYELAVLAWIEVQNPEARRDVIAEGDTPEDREEEEEEWLREKTEECQSWLEKVAAWETFVLDARIGMRVQTGMDTIRWFKRERGWATA